MTERRGVDTGGSLEAACNNLIDLELNALNGRDIHQISSQETSNQSSSPIQRTPRFAELPSSKDTNNDKYIDEANLNRASLCNRGTDDEETTQSTTLEHNRRKEDRQEKNLTENKEHLALNKASDTTQSTTQLKEDKQEENLTENKELLAPNKASGNEKEEGNYEELVCLVRQFYVERPVNPSAIAYQNMETC
ncbi:hypothetical protein ACROYT_G041389 [Oculina patagonica]